MKWQLLNTGFNSGVFNMRFDIDLARNSKPGQAVLRLYRWRPYCISLGAHQSFDSVNLNKATDDNVELVKRPTGGRAILHSEELTYSVIFPISENLSAKNIYYHINLALLEGLTIYNSELCI
jgi:lipoate-protein ligase A